MARPVRVLPLFSLFVLAVARPAFAQPSLAPGADQLPQYRGPSAFYDPEDPLHAARWTLGNTLPERWFLNLPSNLALHRLVQYESDRNTVLLKYLAGEQEVIPPLPFSPAEYAEASFDMGLRRTWVKETNKSLNESIQRGGAQDGLINLNLPNLPFASKIFGDGAPNLRVRGSEQITISGSSSWVVGQVTGEQGGNSLFPKLDMRQRLNVSLDGTIGSKLSVSMAQNSDALTPLENSIKIRYKGLEDEVLKSVELGNTNLTLPSTQFISYSTRQEGLFGVKTEAEVGGVSFTAIASREQGESGLSTFNGGSASRTIRVPDWNYIQGKYFFLVNPNGTVPPPEQVLDVRLYLDDRQVDNNVSQGALPARVWIDPDTTAGRNPPTPATGQFYELTENENYVLANETNFGFPRIQLTNQLTSDHTLAVAYIQKTGDVVDTVGTWWPDGYVPASNDSLNLKMLRPSEEQWGSNDLTTSVWAPVRYLEAKNVYSLMAQDIEEGSLTLNVVRDIAGEGGHNPDYIVNEDGKQTPLLQVLGLDQKNNIDPSLRVPDQRIDPEFVDLPNGVLIFPDLRPFDPDVADIEGNTIRERSWPRNSGAERPDILGWRTVTEPSTEAVRSLEVVPEVYDLKYSRLNIEASDHHIYTIEAQVRAAVSNTIDLGAFGGILQNSETVRLNGEELHKGEGYTIDYETGIVTLKDPDATRPGADLVITYSKDALFARGSKSLFGASLATGRDLNSKFSLSSTWLHESRGTPDRRPRLRQEPTRTTVGDFAGKLRLSPWLLTDLVDMLPLVKTNAPSRLELSGAMGVSFPNPNTRGEVFIDDMEGAEQIVSPGVNRVNWTYSSTPLLAYEHTPVDSIPIEPQDQNRGQLLWFSPNTVQVGDVTPREDSEATRNDPLPVLEVIYVPSNSGGEIDSWGGLSTTLGAQDVSRKQYLEVWLNDNIPNELAHLRRGELLIDIGEISEDAVWDPQTPPDPANGLLDLEDRNTNRGQVEANEDMGLDSLWNANEPPRDGLVFTPKSPAQDPAGDDRVSEINEDAPETFIWQRIHKYQGINGTEENQRLDTEDLDDDYELDTYNNYREYRISLADSAFIDNRRDFNHAGQDLNSGWRMYRIPFSRFSHEVGAVTNLTQVKSMRMWFRGIAPGDTLDLQVASIELVGNNWELADPIRADDLVKTQVFSVGIANNKEDVDYREPFEVRRIDNQKEKEQSIALNFENFEPDSTLRAFRRLQDTYDYTLYQTVGFYLNPRFQDIPTDTVEFYMRFGSDAANDTVSFYEVATRLTEMDARRTADGWINFEFKVSDLSQFKIGGPSVVAPTQYLIGPQDSPPDSGEAPARVDIGNGLLVSVRGNPSMSRVRRLSVGLRNTAMKTPTVLPKGTVWYDELRMGTVRRDMGWASTARASMTLADFADLQGSVDLRNPDFLRLGESRGSGTENLHYDLRGQVGLHKLVEPLHLNMPVQARASRQRLTPKFVPNNDILYEGSSSTGNEISEVKDKGLDLSLSRDGRGLGGPLLRYTVDALRFTGSFGESYRDDVLRDDQVLRLNGSANYNLGLGDIRPLRPLGLINMWLWPRNVTLGLTAGRIRNWIWTPRLETGQSQPTPPVEQYSETRTENLTLSTSIQPISGLTYNFATDRDLIDGHFGTSDTSLVQPGEPGSSLWWLQERPPGNVLGIDIGRAVTVNHNLGFVYSPPLLGRLFSPRFTWTGSSNQSLQPSLTLEDYENAVYDIGNNDNTTVSLTIPLGQLTEKFARKPPPGKATRPNRPKRGANADTTQAKQKESGDSGQFFTKVLRFRDIQTTGSLGHRSSYRNLYGEPSIQYRLGITRDVGPDVATESNAAQNVSFGRTWSGRGTTSLRLLNQVDVDVSLNKRYDRTNMNGRAGLVKNETTWPDLRFDWGELQKKLPIVKRLSDFRIVNTSFNRTTQITGTTDNPNETKTVSNRWSPLISVQGTLPGGWKTQLNANVSSTQTVSQRGGASTTTDRSQNQYTFSLNKKFESGRGTSARDVDVKVDVTYSNNSTETRGARTVQEDKQNQVRLNSTATLRLTRALSGTFGFEVGQESRPTSDWTRRSVRVSFTTGFNF